MLKKLTLIASALVLGTLLNSETKASSDLNQPWSYDPGPDPSTPMGRELIDLVATQPHMPTVSLKVSGTQKFRPPFGPTLWRMIQKPNSVKILFIGQDGTHIAEAAGRTATAGFGGRAQDLAAYFGVKNGAAFINTFAYTIGGQYSAANSPVVSGNGENIAFKGVTDNGMWLMAQDQSSPMVKWRNSLIDWIIRNNQGSLKMIVLFGGSAKDSIATFIESKGGKVASFSSLETISQNQIQVPDFKLVFAGGNNKFPQVLDRSGSDLAQGLLGTSYTLDYTKEEDQKQAMDVIGKNLTSAYSQMRIHNGGLKNSGLVHPAQLGGYNLNKIEINGKNTLSLRGLPLSDGSKIQNEVLVVDLPHPTYLSTVEMENKGSASKLVAQNLAEITPYVNKGWKIEADEGMVNEFAKGLSYRYGRTDIGPEYYDFGTPNNRMVSKSDAVRDEANIIILGTRDRATFNKLDLARATSAPQPPDLDAREMFLARPRTELARNLFDRGPGAEMARIMKENLDMSLIGKPKPGMDPKVSFIDAYNIKTDPVAVGDFGHYRGTFNNPKVVILADPDGVDDMLTSRALTGTRGQYLQGLMNDLGVSDQYLVIKTVPFGMDSATDTEWKTVLAQTAKYRKAIFAEILSSSKPSLIIADGKYASSEIKSLISANIPVVSISKTGLENDSGLKEAAVAISNIPGLKKIKYSGIMANIPRSHLGFFSRLWEGTSGSRVFNSTAKKYLGVAFAVVAPEWAYNQKPTPSKAEAESVDALLRKMDDLKLMRPKENYQDYLKRIKINSTDFWVKFNTAV